MREDASTAVVEQQDAQVAPQIAIPQRILIIEEAQVACHAQHTLIGHRGTTRSSRYRSLDAVDTPVATHVLSGKQIGQAHRLTVGEMQHDRLIQFGGRPQGAFHRQHLGEIGAQIVEMPYYLIQGLIPEPSKRIATGDA